MAIFIQQVRKANKNGTLELTIPKRVSKFEGIKEKDFVKIKIEKAHNEDKSRGK